MSELAPVTLSPAQLLQRLAEELRHCRGFLSGIEHSFHQILEGEIAVDRPGLWQRNIQDIDLMEQHLADLAACLSAMAVEPNLLGAGGLSEARVLGALRLDDLRRRLHGNPEIQTGSTRIELF